MKQFRAIILPGICVALLAAVAAGTAFAFQAVEVSPLEKRIQKLVAAIKEQSVQDTPLRDQNRLKLALRLAQFEQELTTYPNGDRWIKYLALSTLEDPEADGELEKSAGQQARRMRERFNKISNNPTYGKIAALPAFLQANETLASFIKASAEPAKAEPVKAEPVTTEPVGTNPASTKPNSTKPATAEPVTPEPVKEEPTLTEPAKTEPAKIEPTPPEPTTAEPATTGLASPEPAKTEPTPTESGKAEPATTGSVKEKPTLTEPGKAVPATTEPATPEPAKTEPAKTEPTSREPTKAKPDSTVPTDGDRGREKNRDKATGLSAQDGRGDSQPKAAPPVKESESNGAAGIPKAPNTSSGSSGNPLNTVALVVIVLLLFAITAGIVVLGSLPVKIARQRNHPYPDAVNAASWIGLATGVFWPVAFVWAFFPMPSPGKASLSGKSKGKQKPASDVANLQDKIDSLKAQITELQSADKAGT